MATQATSEHTLYTCQQPAARIRIADMPRWFTILLAVICAVPVTADDPDGSFQPLITGQSLDNWTLTNTPPETWTIRDGLLICSGKPIGEIRTREMFQNFILELEWRHIVPGGNAGIFLWADDIPAKGVPFHRGIEVQILELAYGNTRSHTTHGDIFPIHGARMTPVNGRGGSRAFPTEHHARPAPEWNHYRITCQDGKVDLEVNGNQVTSGHSCRPCKGYICLESEGGIVHYRNMRILRLPDTPIESHEIATADRGYRSIYTGLDLSGWSDKDKDLHAQQTTNGWRVSDWKLTHEGAASELSHRMAADTRGLLLDIQRLSPDASLTIQLSSPTEQRTIYHQSADTQPSAEIGSRNGWNRIRADWTDKDLNVTVNDVPSEIQPQPGQGEAPQTLILKATGKVEFANLFVR